MTRVCTICARGGSKGVPGKNIRLLGGKPLIAHSVERALETGLFEVVAISSDDDTILEAGRAAGAGLLIKRPDELATDESGKVPAIVHALLAVEAHLGREVEILVDLATTAPLRRASDIADAVALLEVSGATSVITGSAARASPNLSMVERAPDGTVHVSKRRDPPYLRRQDSPAVFEMNGSIYVWRRDPFVAAPSVFYADTRLLEMPAERSVDIDTEFDFRVAEFVHDAGLARG
jgi:CMP-N-acetylneuraminic acid synthetase